SALSRFWPSLAPNQAIGRQVRLQPFMIDRGSSRRAPALVPMTIVGIAADVRSGETLSPYIYLPIQQHHMAALRCLVRARGDLRGIPVVRELLLGMDRRLPVLAAGALEDQAGPVTV